MKVSYEAAIVPPPPVCCVRGVGNVGSEFPEKVMGKGKGKAKGDSSEANPVSVLEGDATSKPSARVSAKPSSMKATFSRAEKRKRKADVAGADLVGTSVS